MPNPTPRPSVLRRESWPFLELRLEEASRQSTMPATRDVLLRPLQLLELMSADAAGALGDDVLAAERLRMLLYLAEPFQAMVDEARSLDESSAAREDAYEPGVLDHGSLAIVALGALRVALPGSERAF